MKICIRERCPRLEINDDHAAGCWVNVAEAGDPPEGTKAEEPDGEN